MNRSLTIVRPSTFGHGGGLVAGMSTRAGGPADSTFGLNLSYNVGDDPARVGENRERFFGAMGVGTGDLAFMQQVHGLTITKVDAPGVYPSCDGLTTNVAGVFLCVTVADCVPIFIFDRGAPALAVVHAGWRGTAGGIAGAAVAALCAAYGARASRMEAFIGPAATECCYQVGEDVAAAFPAGFVTVKNGAPHVSLKGVNRDHLIAAGVPPDAIELHPGCTIHDGSLYHSFRRDGNRSGRMVGVAGMVSG